MSNDDIGPSSPHQCPGAASGQRSEDCVLAGGCLVSAMESAGVLAGVIMVIVCYDQR